MTHEQRRSGQIAVGALVVMGFIASVVYMIVNLGQAAQVRVETSNASDAGALAFGSWAASGQNEAAWVSRKMHDSNAMVTALLTIPACPGVEKQRYMDELWQSLASAPGTSPGQCKYGQYAECGPVGYFRQVANGAMEASWFIGRREFITSTTNNMMVRFPTTTDAVCFGYPPIGCVETTAFGDLAELIKQRQEEWNTETGGETTGGGFNWNNGRPLGDPELLDHRADIFLDVTNANDPPTMVVSGKTAAYAQWNELTPAEAANYDNYQSPGPYNFHGWGIRNVYPDLGNAPLARLPTRVLFPGFKPLAVDSQGVKNWDFALDDGSGNWFGLPPVPRVGDLQIGPCDELVMGMTPRTTPSVPVHPTRIANGTRSYNSEVWHGVSQRGSDPGPGGWPIYQKRFPNIASHADAQFTEATIPPDAWTIPARDAKAQLTGTQ